MDKGDQAVGPTSGAPTLGQNWFAADHPSVTIAQGRPPAAGEIGLLRAVGTTRRQIRRLIRLESVLIATHGALLGTGLGLAWGIAGQKALVAQGITT